MKALIAMSGGVDSSVAALLTKEQGLEVVGCTMVLHEEGLAAENAVSRAEESAKRIGIPFEVLDLRKEFKTHVIRPFCEAYEHGLTPNPCIYCNRYLKFGKLFEEAKRLGADFVVTGHYARVEMIDGRPVLLKALDGKKDQSYVLYQFTEEELRHVRFPLGGLSKEEIRRIARAYELPSAASPESQDICFIPDGDYAAFLDRSRGVPDVPGPFVKDGKTVGMHKGITHYTVGQRKGLGLAFGEPVYVTDVDPETRTVTLGSSEDLMTETAWVRDFHWIAPEVPTEPFKAAVKTRYHQKEVPATVIPDGEGHAKILFETPLRAVTPGQSAVFYDGDRVLGGGIIEKH